MSRRLKTNHLSGGAGLLAALIASAVNDSTSDIVLPHQKRDAIDWINGSCAPLPYKFAVQSLGLPEDIKPYRGE